MYIGRGLDAISNVEKLDNITFDGSATYALTKSSAAFTPVGANNLLVSIDGVVQMGNFSVSTTNISFDWSPTSSNTNNFILHYGTGVLNVPADGSVSAAKMAANSVDSDSYVDGSIDTAHIDALQVTGAKLNTDVISAQTELAAEPADADEFMVSDAGVLKRVDYSYIKAATTLAALTDATVSASDPATDTNPSATGHLWVNKTSGEVYICSDITTDDNVWVNIGDGVGGIEAFDIVGGTTFTYTYGGNTYNIRKFSTTATFTTPGTGTADALLVAGGGAGGCDHNSGGGGAGGVLWRTGQTFSAGVTYTATIGAGGDSSSDSGSGADSTITGSGFSTLTATGGGYGGSSGGGAAGGSGGGGRGVSSPAGGSGTSGQGNDGGAGASSGADYDHHGGGGGGAGAVGGAGNHSTNNSGDGGAGGTTLTNQSAATLDATETTALFLGAEIGTDSSNAATTSSSTGTLYLAGGGGGGSSWSAAGGGGTSSNCGGSAGVGGGGRGTDDVGEQDDAPGIDGTGGGGGGQGRHIEGDGKSGGNGVIVIRWAD